MRTWTFPEAKPDKEGPWTHEPDKAQWVDEATGLDCLIVRAEYGYLCGYVGVPPEHLFHGMTVTQIRALARLDVHGGVNFTSPCQEGGEERLFVCHVPEPGRPEKVWWLGFDCGHVGDDYSPGMAAVFERLGMTEALADDGPYRTFPYVQEQCTKLATQLARVGARQEQTVPSQDCPDPEGHSGFEFEDPLGTDRFGKPDGVVDAVLLGRLIGAGFDGCAACQIRWLDAIQTDPLTTVRLVELAAVMVHGALGGIPARMLDPGQESTFSESFRLLLRTGVDGQCMPMMTAAEALTDGERRQAANDALDMIIGRLVV